MTQISPSLFERYYTCIYVYDFMYEYAWQIVHNHYNYADSCHVYVGRQV